MLKYETFTVTLVAFSVILILVISLFPISPAWLFTLYVADLVVCSAFTWEFFVQLSKASKKSEFLKHHGYEALAVIPVFIFFPVKAFSGIIILFRLLKLVPLVSVQERKVRFRNIVYHFIQKSHFL
jgi:voltage-gated potassium channel